MKKLFAAILLVTTLLTLAACGNKNNNGSVDNPDSDLITVWLIAEISEGRNNKTTYTYDEKGNFLSSTVYFRDQAMITTEWTYDNDDKVAKVMTYSHNEPTDGPAYLSFSYDEQDRLARIRCLDENDDELWFYIYTYDEKGNLIKREDEDRYVTNYTYDDHNRIISETSFWDSSQASHYEYTYDDNGFLIKKYAENRSEIYTNDDNGNPIEIVYYDANGEESSTYRLTYTSVRVSAKRAKELRILQRDLI